MPRFVLHLEDSKGFFYPGETIVGRIVATLDEAIKFKRMTLEFKGESNVQWTTGSGNDREFHSNHEVYFENCVQLMEPQQRDKDITLQPGEFNFPFQFQLPPNLPPSTIVAKAEGSGSVSYAIKIKLVRGKFKSEDISAYLPFEVITPPMDLNEIRDLLEPMSHTEEKYLCCLCCQSGPLRLSIKIEKRFFYVGEQIVFSVEVDNRETDEPLGKIEAKLKAFFTFISKSGNTKSIMTEDLSSVRIAEGVAPRSEQNWHDVTLNTPAHATPTFDNCKCINLDYVFTVKIEINMAFNPKVYFPITISSNPQMLQQVPASEECVMPPPYAAEVPPSMARPLPGSAIPTAGYPPPPGYPPPGHSASIITQQPRV